jgi:hypothetical protein
MSLDQLPDELFRTILDYLTPEETAALGQTCRRLNRISRDEQVWQRHVQQR